MGRIFGLKRRRKATSSTGTSQWCHGQAGRERSAVNYIAREAFRCRIEWKAKERRLVLSASRTMLLSFVSTLYSAGTWQSMWESAGDEDRGPAARLCYIEASTHLHGMYTAGLDIKAHYILFLAIVVLPFCLRIKWLWSTVAVLTQRASIGLPLPYLSCRVTTPILDPPNQRPQSIGHFNRQSIRCTAAQLTLPSLLCLNLEFQHLGLTRWCPTSRRSPLFARHLPSHPPSAQSHNLWPSASSPWTAT